MVHGEVKGVDKLEDHEQIGRKRYVFLIKLLFLFEADNDFNFLGLQSLVKVFGEFLKIPMLIYAIIGILRFLRKENQMVQVRDIDYIHDHLVFIYLALVNFLGVQRVQAFVCHHYVPVIRKERRNWLLRHYFFGKNGPVDNFLFVGLA